MMWFTRKRKKRAMGDEKAGRQAPADSERSLADLFNDLRQSKDFVSRDHALKNMTVRISYVKPLIDTETMHRDVTRYLLKSEAATLEDLIPDLPYTTVIHTKDVKEMKEKLLRGYVLIQENQNEANGILLETVAKSGRQVDAPEVEFSVIGPKESFVESLEPNLYLIRKRLPISDLRIKEVVVGKLTKSRIAVIYIEGIANKENLNTLTQRLKDIQYDQVIDSSFITQMVADNNHSPFPQLLDTERPDRVVSGLVEGKIAMLVDGSPLALMGPTTIVEFFSAFDDYALTWYLASAFRMIRLASVAFSVLATPLYVAVLTYHYQLIPKSLIGTIISSRMGIPFPPFVEAFFMEITIEVLREAGVRLPTKVGQTIGIVGGIVIGTASVQANLTSNILLILVGMGALASFTTPNYKMNNTVRLLRFPFLIAAAFWGLIGIGACFGLIVAHLLTLKSLGRPYIEPFFPYRVRDLKDAFVRLPYNQQGIRPQQLRPLDTWRLSHKKKKGRDIDE